MLSLYLPTALAFTPAQPEIADRYRCAACSAHDELGTDVCGVIGTCRFTVEGECETACPAVAPVATAAASPVQLRVAKGFGTKPYGTLRVSAITAAGEPAPFDGATYSEAFKYKWKHNALHSSVLSTPTGSKFSFPLQLHGNVSSTSLFVPKQGAGVAGVLIADPCVSGSKVGCAFEKRFKTTDRTMELVDSFAKHDDVSFWGILGDNFYDQTGDMSAREYAKLSLATQSKITLHVPGNHDYWVMGSPALGTRSDQYANGFMQWYAQDTRAGRADLPSGAPGANASAMPFDFSSDPSKGHGVFGGSLPAIDNSFFYNQVGNVGFIGYSGAYKYDELMALMTEACAWLPTQPGLELAVLLGHWDTAGLGATSKTAAPGLYDHVKGLPGCAALDVKRQLKFVMGHTHCNVPHPHGHVDTGFMVAGMGMQPSAGVCPSNSNYGIPVLDTTGGRVQLWYFPVVAENKTDTYDAVHDCVSGKGWRQCTHLAVSWLDQPLA